MNTLASGTRNVALMIVVISVLTSAQAATDHNEDKFVYAVHAICGFGSTSINVLNPNAQAVSLTKKGIPLFSQVPTAPHAQQQETLKSQWAFIMTCDDIVGLAGNSPTGASDIVIDSDRELDVWAIYTVFVAGGGVGDTRIVHIDPSRLKK